jgi:DNA-binding NtrC family response regulator
MKHGKLLIVDDKKTILQALTMFLQFEFEKVQTISSPNLLSAELESDNYDIVLLDMNFKAGQSTGNEGLYWLREIKKRFPETEVVMFTAFGDVGLAVNALKEGAADFVLKPWENEKLIATLKSAYRLRKSNGEIKELKGKEQSMKIELNRGEQLIIGKSSAMQQVMNLVKKVAATDANVLITGENGTGKGVISKEIHRLSHRKNELFVLVDLAALAETLFESELFGHKKGSYTGATDDRIGKFVLANKGTLFLDEIGNIPLNLQAKLLTVLQSRTVTPVGSDKEAPIDIRLVSATNKNIGQMVSEGQFRQDLLYRLNTIEIHLPPLRERAEDIEDLAGYYVALYGKKYGKPQMKISLAAITKLQSQSWPGNIRELQHAIEKAVILADGTELRPIDFMGGFEMDQITSQPETLEEMEKQMIASAMKRHAGNLTIVSAKLGISRPTLYSKIERYGI